MSERWQVEDHKARAALKSLLEGMHPDAGQLPIDCGWIGGFAGHAVVYYGIGESAAGLVSLLLDTEDPLELGDVVTTSRGPIVVWTPDSGTGLALAVAIPDSTHPDALLENDWGTMWTRFLATVSRRVREGSFDGTVGVGTREDTGKPYIYCVGGKENP